MAIYVQQLETFIRVAEEGSFGWAANTLFISTPAVVQQISLFEEHCGVTLFKRSNRGVQLTPTGQALYEDGKKIIALSNQALARAQQIEEDSKETLQIGTSPIFRARVLIDAMTMAREDELPLKFEIPNLVAELSQMNNNFDLLGQKCDLLETIYCDIAW
ncbi:LysR family transcriptional regulator [Limosilactobacillus fermentum]|uniref:LysR family transcriptional regulator n=1 Tax=Limosilactobacillus fermentum TaxID=1613 RepID=UPI00202758E4|nr:LysR family transcriptional regulator [Limosilactobacillus fermentum]URL82286.1 LysR family transcriptional regulator [Limosilactobacillus fermentum]